MNSLKHKLSFLVLLVVALPLMGAQQNVTAGIANFSQFLANLEKATGIKAKDNFEIMKYYNENTTRFSKNGLVSEINDPTLMNYAALAGLFCKAHAEAMLLTKTNTNIVELDKAKPGSTTDQVDEKTKIKLAHAYANLFLDRDATPLEIKNNLDIAATMKNAPNMRMSIGFCSTFGASIEFIFL